MFSTMRLICVALSILFVYGHQEDIQLVASNDLIQAEETALEQSPLDRWVSSKWRRDEALQRALRVQAAQDCIREIESSKECMCSPRDVLVDIPSLEVDAQKTLPKCVTVKRCAGPCSQENDTCVPKDVGEILVPVVTRECGRGYAKVQVHKSCQCSYMLKETDCDKEGQTFDRHAGKCVCARRSSCPADRPFFNTKSCQCECVDGSEECSTGFHFNPKTCRCEEEEQDLES